MKSVQSQTVNITLPKPLLKQVDALAKRDYTSRSDIIRQALLFKVRFHGVDEWGDPEGLYKTMVDFRKIDPNGVSIKEVITAIKELQNQ